MFIVNIISYIRYINCTVGSFCRNDWEHFYIISDNRKQNIGSLFTKNAHSRMINKTRVINIWM